MGRSEYATSGLGIKISLDNFLNIESKTFRTAFWNDVEEFVIFVDQNEELHSTFISYAYTALESESKKPWHSLKVMLQNDESFDDSHVILFFKDITSTSRHGHLRRGMNANSSTINMESITDIFKMLTQIALAENLKNFEIVHYVTLESD